jgi:predicted nucleotide-binding protein
MDIMDKETENVINNLDALCRDGRDMTRFGSPDKSKFIPWQAEAIDILTRNFGRNDTMVVTFIETVKGAIKTDVEIGINLLERIRWQLFNQTRVLSGCEPSTPKTFSTEYKQPRIVQEKTNKVFIVHGHHDPMREEVSNYVHKLGLDPIILADEASIGKTLIEKLEGYNDVNYAIVLLTPDDLGGQNKNELKTRARQNVIFELGFFIGCLGRENVCPFKRSVEELPSDFIGVVFINFDKDWKISLVRELQKSGFDINLNKI